MKAAINHTYGSPDVLRIQEVEKPSIAEDEVLVQVHASAVTQGDRRLRAADFPGISSLLGRLVAGIFRPKHPIPGSVFAGRIVAVGARVEGYAVGEDVFGVGMHGAQAEFLAVPEKSPLARMPAGLDYEEAASIPYGAGTALTFLSDLGELERGQRVLVIGASGGVGLHAVQLASHLGAEVTGVCSPQSFELVRGQGATHLIDYATEDFTGSGERYDLIFDTLGATGFARARRALSPEGRYLTLLLTLRALFQMALTRLLGGQRALFGVSLGGPEHQARVGALVEQGAFRPVIDRRFPLARLAQAHTHLEERRSHGSVVITVRPAPAERLAA